MLTGVQIPDDTPEAVFGAKLRRLREGRGLSQQALARALDFASHSTIADYESGKRLPGVDVVRQYETYFELKQGTLGAPRERAREQRIDDPQDGTLEGDLGDIECPYKGLRAFEAEDARWFFGREAETAQVLARLAQVRFVAVIGASGSGKSSFVRAGLLARLRVPADGGGAPRVILLTPGEHPVDALASAVASETGVDAGVLSEELREDPQRLREIVARGGGDGRVVVAVDQFEELFSLCRDEADRRCFVDALTAAWSDPTSPVLLIMALRADFYGRIAVYPELAAAVIAHQALIGPMSPENRRRAIERPAEEAGLELQRGLTDTILEDLGDEPGALPLLSHALLETWQRKRRLQLTVADYREAGGVRGAIAQTAERTLQTLTQADAPIAQSIFLALTEVGERADATRRRVDRGELTADPETAVSVDRVISVLADARLVTLEENTIVLAHEALISHWPRLRGWLETDRADLLIQRRVTQAAREWDTLNREPGALYRGARLAAAREWASEHPEHAGSLEHDFLVASEHQQHAEQATKRRRRRRTVAGLAAALVIVSALAVVALIQSNQASDERDTAQATLLASNALAALATDPGQSLVLALQAYATKPIPVAEDAVRLTASQATPQLVFRAHPGAPVVAGDGIHLATVGADGRLRVWDWRAPRTPLAILPGDASSASVVFSGDGRHLATVESDGTVWVWDWHAPRTALAILHVGLLSIFGGVAFSSDGRHLATAGFRGTVRVWDWRASRTPWTMPHDANDALAVAFSGDGRYLAAGEDGRVVVWDWRAPHPRPIVLPDQPGFTTYPAVAFSGDGRHLAGGGDNGAVRVWDWRAPRTPPTSLPGHQGEVDAVAFAANGVDLASAGRDGTVRVWNWRTPGTPPIVLLGHQGEVIAVAFAGDGRYLASGGTDGTVRVWDWRATRTPPTVLRPTRFGLPPGNALAVAFAADGRHLASAGDDGVFVWDWRAPLTRPTPLTWISGAFIRPCFSRVSGSRVMRAGSCS